MIKYFNSLFSWEQKYLVEICICSIFILYMQYEKIKWIVSNNTSGLIDLLRYCYPELYFVSLLVFVSLFFKHKIYLFLVFLLYYYLAVFNFTSWFIQGRPFSFFDIYRSIQLFLFYPEFLTEIETVLKWKVAIFIVIPFIALVSVRVFHSLAWLRQDSVPRFINQFSLGCIILVVLSFPVGINAKIFHFSTPVEIAGDTYRNIQIRQMSLRPENAFQLLGISEANFKTEPVFDFRSKNFLFFIIETAPYDFYPSLKELCRLTANDWLAEHGRIFTRHYATYPESERAIFSIVSGQYPPLAYGDKWKQNLGSFSLADFLNSKEYVTYFLGTAPLEFHNDRAMVEGLGFSNIYDVKETNSARIIVDGKKDWDRTKIYRFDEILKEKALDVISAHAAAKETQPFFMVLAPQSSHAPFQIPPGNNKAENDKDKIKLNAIWQFNLLKSLVNELKHAGQLQNTVIVVTGDHGIRSKYESDLFSDPKLLQSVSFHVPLMIAFDEMESSTVDKYATSHVDIVPTIVNAFHDETNPGRYHGLDLFASPRPERNVFLFGGGSLPVAGLVNREGYFMENRYLRMFYKSSAFDFTGDSRNALVGSELVKFSNKMISVRALLYTD